MTSTAAGKTSIAHGTCWAIDAERGHLKGRLVRYCDDFVLLSRQRPDRELAWLQQLLRRLGLTRLGLTLHPSKTRVVDTRRAAGTPMQACSN